MDKFIIGIQNIPTWNETFEELQKYVNENSLMPTSCKDGTPQSKRLAKWVNNQRTNYSRNIKMLKHPEIRKRWEDFLKSIDHLIKNIDAEWITRLNDVKAFINQHHRSPRKLNNNDEETKLYYWIQSQRTNLKNNTKMLSQDWVRDLFNKFLNDYKDHFFSFDEKWEKNFNDLDDFIRINHKVPSIHKEDEKKLSIWQTTQKKNYKKQEQIMSKIEYRQKWEELREKYPNDLLSKEELWFYHLRNIRQFVNTYGRKPSKHSLNNDERFLGEWLGHSTQNYNQKKNNMTNEEIRTAYEEFSKEIALIN